MEGTKHLIECHCILPQYRRQKNPVFHKFIVFSVIDDSDTVVPKFVQCNNCDIVHKVIDICSSEMITGKEELRTIAQKDDIAFGLKNDVCSVLESYSCDIATWEEVKFILDHKKWGTHVILTREDVDDHMQQGKLLVIDGHDNMRIEPFTLESTVDLRQHDKA